MNIEAVFKLRNLFVHEEIKPQRFKHPQNSTEVRFVPRRNIVMKEGKYILITSLV